MRKIAIIISQPLCYESGRYFAYHLQAAFEELHQESELFSIAGKNDEETGQILEKLCSEEYSAILDYNSIMPRLQLEDGELFLNRLGIPFYHFVVDHPLYHHPILKLPVENYHVVVLDENHRQYIEENYPHMKEVKCLSLPGMEAVQEVPYEEKKQTLLFCGSYTNPADVVTLIQDLPVSKKREVMELIDASQEFLDSPIEKLGWKRYVNGNSKVSFPDYMNELYLADMYMRAWQRHEVMRELVKAEIPLSVYGTGWGRCSFAPDSSLSIHKAVDFNVMPEITAAHAFVLNVQPQFKSGFHDRVFTGMINGCTVLTDSINPLPKGCVDGNSLYVYPREEIQSVGDLVREWMEHQNQGKQIGKAAKQIANAQYSYNKYARTILGFLAN